MKRKYVIAPYGNTVAMYENDDFRLVKYKRTDIIQGDFEKTKSVKGTVNGLEIGIFHGNNGTKYIIFIDHSAKAVI